MEELIANLDAAIAAELAIIDPLRVRLAEAEKTLNRLQAAKHELTGQAPINSVTKRPRRYVTSGPKFAAETVAQAIEKNGPLPYTELAKAVSPEKNSAGLTHAMRQKPHWFTRVDGPRTAITLTDAGRNRHTENA